MRDTGLKVCLHSVERFRLVVHPEGHLHVESKIARPNLPLSAMPDRLVPLPHGQQGHLKPYPSLRATAWIYSRLAFGMASRVHAASAAARAPSHDAVEDEVGRRLMSIGLSVL